jgi:uncharacterized membrane protein HdeD (DUF308 family)
MLETLSRRWWLIALRGVLAILFGLVAFIWPGPTIIALALLFGAYMLVDGVLAFVAAISGRGGDRWWVLMLEGLVGVLAGIAAFIWPGLTALVAVYLIAAWALLTGVLEIAAAIRLRRQIEGEWLLVVGGVLSILLAVLLFVLPGAGATALVWVLGAYAILFGIMLLALSFRVRGHTSRREPVTV